jgi:UDP-N-acetylmuramate: L-alanyl-gamma-D-glutamyl-meso-diaminopimelate ligase
MAISRIHFIGIGDPVMSDLAIALKTSGHVVTTSEGGSMDDLVHDKLQDFQLLPPIGWQVERIQANLEGVIISPAIALDNPELKQAQALKLPVFSYPEFVRKESRNKHRIVVTGSYGKTMITLLILHVLNYHKRSFDYLLGRPVPGVKHSVRLSDAPVIVIEGQDVLASSLDPTPMFLKYQHHLGVISGIEWSESSAYRTKEDYTRQFSLFEKATPKGGVLIYFDLEPVVTVLGKVNQPDVLYIPYKTHPSQSDNGQEYLVESASERHPIKLSGKLNMQNISAAKETVKKLGITTPMFYEAIQRFGGDSL